MPRWGASRVERGTSRRGLSCKVGKGPMRAERKRNETMAQITTIHSLKALEQVLANLPEGTTCNVLASDLEAGNFETAHFEFGNGIVQDVQYTGPVTEGYVSPHDQRAEYS